MANDLRTGSQPSVTSLVTGIASDLQDLLAQQLALFKAEVESDLTRTKEAALVLAGGLGVAVVAGILLCLMLVFLLQWATELPLWACYGIIGCGLALVGGTLVYVGRKRFESFNPLPDQSVRALKENVQCLTNPK
jgi:hypothetical protein